MNTNLLKQAKRHRDGSRRWIVPGRDHAIVYLPSTLTPNDWGPTVRWPSRDAKGDLVRSVDINRYRTMAKTAIRKLLSEITAV
jgi:hypothetical protein